MYPSSGRSGFSANTSYMTLPLNTSDRVTPLPIHGSPGDLTTSRPKHSHSGSCPLRLSLPTLNHLYWVCYLLHRSHQSTASRLSLYTHSHLHFLSRQSLLILTVHASCFSPTASAIGHFCFLPFRFRPIRLFSCLSLSDTFTDLTGTQQRLGWYLPRKHS